MQRERGHMIAMLTQLSRPGDGESAVCLTLLSCCCLTHFSFATPARNPQSLSVRWKCIWDGQRSQIDVFIEPGLPQAAERA